MDHDMLSSRAEVWNLKPISFGAGERKRPVKIITQNFNGPCSFIAICNILILRGNIEILPHERTTVSYEFLSQLVGEYLLSCSTDVDVSAALSIMPATQKGMDLNPVFTSPTSFHPAEGTGGELKLFEQVGIKLVHGWLVDPDSAEAGVIARTPDYDAAVHLIADADHLTDGHLVLNEHPYPHPAEDDVGGPSVPSSSMLPNGKAERTLTDEERDKVTRAIAVHQFLHSTQSQLTYHGLFTLASTLEPGALVALFRNSHLSVLYRPEGHEDEQASLLYTLVTDHAFLREPSVVWECLEDVDGGWSTFVDSDMVRSSPAGGDFAGQTAEATLQATEYPSESADQALARQLQAEENELARREYVRQERQRQEARQREGQQRQQQQRRESRYPEMFKRRKKQCVIM